MILSHPQSEQLSNLEIATLCGCGDYYVAKIKKDFESNPEFKRIRRVLLEVFGEVLKATEKHKPLNSPHEEYAVIKEEVDELWDEVKCDRGRQESARQEAIQIAAMGVRYLIDLFEAKK